MSIKRLPKDDYMKYMWLICAVMTTGIVMSGCGAEACMDIENCASHDKTSATAVCYWPF
jgi:hypothetical protein